MTHVTLNMQCTCTIATTTRLKRD